MKSWMPHPPHTSTLGDHEVLLESQHLTGKRIVLLLTGSISSYKAPGLIRELRRHGAEVIVYASREALKYVAQNALEWASTHSVITKLTPHAEHLENSSPFSIYILAPATYNTINKFCLGAADSLITSTLAVALGRMEKGLAKIFIAPTMNGQMHNSILQESLCILQTKGVVLIPPRDEYGKHNLPDEKVIVAYVCAHSTTSALKGKKILVTGGPTPTKIDSVRRITNKFTGRLAIEIAKELCFRGADVKLVLGKGSEVTPTFIATQIINDYDEYKNVVLTSVKEENPDIGIFSAAVADYIPKNYINGKIPSGTLAAIELVGTEKVIDLVREIKPQMQMVSFKYQENMTHNELVEIGKARLLKGHTAVVVNRGEELTDDGQQIAYLLSIDKEIRLETKKGIALGLVNFLETCF